MVFKHCWLDTSIIYLDQCQSRGFLAKLHIIHLSQYYHSKIINNAYNIILATSYSCTCVTVLLGISKTLGKREMESRNRNQWKLQRVSYQFTG